MANRLAIAVAVILGVLAALAVRTYLRTEEDRQRMRYRTTDIIVAKKTIKKGEPLRLTTGQAGMITRQEYPERMIKTGMITPAEIARYKGYIASNRVEAGAPIFRQDLELPIEQTVVATSVVAEGFRAVTIPVDMVSGVAGLVRVGDRVDVIGTFKESGTRNTETVYLLQNVRILALDNRTTSSIREEKRSGRPYRTVTLEVRPEDALRLVNAQEQGRVHLMLRHRSDVNMEPAMKNGHHIAVDVVANELKDTVPHTQANGE